MRPRHLRSARWSRVTLTLPALSIALGLVLLVGAGVGVANLSHPKPTLPDVGCWLGFYEGEFVEGAGGTAIVLPDGSTQLVRWPSDWTLRNEGGAIAVYDRNGNFAVRTGTRVHLAGGMAPDGV